MIVDVELARLYAVSTSRYNEAIKRNRCRLAGISVFSVTAEEYRPLRSQFAILKKGRSEIGNTERDRMGPKDEKRMSI